MLIGALLKGIVVGIVIAVPVGPVGILCIRRTVFAGKIAGLLSGVGAATADAIFGAVAAFGLTVIAKQLLDYEVLLRVGGGVVLLYVGGKGLLGEPHTAAPANHDAETLIRYAASAFALTITNPITILSFAAIFAAIGLAGEHVTLGDAAILVLGVWCGSALWWLAVSFASGVLLGAVEERHLRWFNRVSAGILLLCGIALLGTVVGRVAG
jgi:threonine/homoserine/homoserine lactone efflux protein